MEKNEVERLYDTYASRLYGFLLTLVKDEPLARDLLQDVFVKVARSEDFLEGVVEERPFLFRVARNTALDFMRKRAVRNRVRRDLAASVDLFARTEDPDSSEFRSRLSEALAALPEEQRSVVFLRLWGGETVDGIAGICGVSANTAASRYRYGIDKMRKQLRSFYEEIST
ncbi:MAG: RNA polymerase sigma factor [Verrucomicrobiota bacterium]